MIYQVKKEYSPIKFKVKGYDYDWFHNEIFDEEYDDEDFDNFEESIDLSVMQPLECDEVKVEKVLKILTTNKLLTRLPILLAQRKQFIKIKEKCPKSISIIKLLKKFTTIESSYYNHGRKYDCNKRSQKFFF